VVLVDIGGGTADIAIYSSGSIVHTSVLPVGGNHLTRDIALGLSTPLEEAESLKHKHGVAQGRMVGSDETIQVPSVGGRKTRTLDKRLMAEIIEPRMREIFEMVGRTLDESTYRNVIASGAVITGGTSMLPGADELAQEILNLPVRVGFPENISGLNEMVYSPMYATGVGLLRYALNGGGLGHSPALQGEHGLFDRMSRRMKEWVNEYL
jgi:cell division protein FtsA